jgi:signal transduction histidine kinase
MKFDEAIGTGWSKAVHPDDLPHVMRDYLENFENKKNFELLFRLKRHDGEYRWVLAYGVPRYGSKGSFEGFLGSCVDITERKSTEENLKKITEQLLCSNNELERFAYIASHDLQEPIRTMVNFSQLLSRKVKGKLDSESQMFVEYIINGGRRMMELIQDLLSYSRVEKDVDKFQEVDCMEVMKDVLTEICKKWHQLQHR